jgi:predicted RNA-binding Zn-ribbon protein involved in translation (DUF1610 family)
MKRKKTGSGQLCPNCNQYMVYGNLIDLDYTDDETEVVCISCEKTVTVRRAATYHFTSHVLLDYQERE